MKNLISYKKFSINEAAQELNKESINDLFDFLMTKNMDVECSKMAMIINNLINPINFSMKEFFKETETWLESNKTKKGSEEVKEFTPSQVLKLISKVRYDKEMQRYFWTKIESLVKEYNKGKKEKVKIIGFY
jgi:hypothetical protein